MKTIFDTIWEPENNGNDSEQNVDPMNVNGASCGGESVYMCCGGGGGGASDAGYAGPWYAGGCVPNY